MIKAIFFDLGGVVYTNGTKKFIEYLTAKYNLNIELVRDSIDGDIGTLYREAKITRDEYWKRCLQALHISADIIELENTWIEGYKLIPGTKDLINELSQSYNIYFLSDNVKERVDRINDKYHFEEWFSGGIYSHEQGIRKPNPQIFALALEKAQVTPNESIFIDDKPQFLIPAKKMGMQTFLFENPEKLKRDLILNHILE